MGSEPSSRGLTIRGKACFAALAALLALLVPSVGGAQGEAPAKPAWTVRPPAGQVPAPAATPAVTSAPAAATPETPVQPQPATAAAAPAQPWASAPVDGPPDQVLRAAIFLGYPMVLENDEFLDGVVGVGVEAELLAIPWVHPIVSFAYARLDINFDFFLGEIEGDSNVYTVMAGLRLRPIPLEQGRLSPHVDFQGGYAFVEGGVGDARDDSNNGGIRGGGGVEYGVADHASVGLRLDYARIFEVWDEDEDQDTLNFLGTLAFAF